MPAPEPSAEVDALLARLSAGDGRDRERLLELLYGELRRQAGALLAGERAGHTLQPTALVHEAWLKLVDQRTGFAGRRHFLALAAQAMRRVLVDHARARAAAKRGGAWDRVTLSRLGPELDGDPDTQELDLLALEEALVDLERESPRRARVVELIWFGGLTADEAASALEVSVRTVGADWRYARAWLYDRLAPDEGSV